MTQYATADEFKAYPHGTKVPDADLAGLLEQASAAIDGVCGWGDGAFAANATATARAFDGTGKDMLRISPAVSITAVTLDGTAIATADWYGVRANPGRPYTAIGLKRGLTFDATDRQNVVVTAVWGYSLTPPDGVVHATILQAAEFIKERGSQSVALPGRTGPSVNGGRARVAQHLDRILMPFRRVA